MDIDAYLLQRYNTLKAMIYISALVCVGFFFVNFFYSRTILTIINLVIFCVDCVFLLNFQKITQSKYKENFVVSYSILLMIALVFLSWSGSVENLTYMWMLIIPFSGYLINDFNNGFRLTAFFMTLSLGIYFYNTQMISDAINYKQVFNVISVSFFIWALIHMHEKTRLSITNKLIELTTIDQLTKLKTRAELYKTYRSYKDIQMCLLIINVDGLKDINDKHGFLAGDVVLMNVANIITQNKPDNAYSFRTSSDKFVILFPNASCENCLSMAKKIFSEISDFKTVLKHEVIPIKINMSLAEIESDGNNADDLITEATRLLEQARQSKTDKIALA